MCSCLSVYCGISQLYTPPAYTHLCRVSPARPVCAWQPDCTVSTAIADSLVLWTRRLLYKSWDSGNTISRDCQVHDLKVIVKQKSHFLTLSLFVCLSTETGQSESPNHPSDGDIKDQPENGECICSHFPTYPEKYMCISRMISRLTKTWPNLIHIPDQAYYSEKKHS